MHSDWVDVYPRPQQPVRVQLEPRKVDDLLGVHVPLEESESILRRLGFQVRSEPGGQWDVLPPVFRLDVELPEDIVEEVGRIYGIARIPATLPGCAANTACTSVLAGPSLPSATRISALAIRAAT